MIRIVHKSETEMIDKVVVLHKKAFKGFFLSTMHSGFLRKMYLSFCEFKNAELLVYVQDDEPVGFIAYSRDTSGIYSYMLWHHFFSFFWYSFLEFLEHPPVFKKMFSAVGMPKSSVRSEHYVKVFSIGVDPDCQQKGIGTELINELKRRLDFSIYRYITLETDADNNDGANAFYLKNGFVLSKRFTTREGRRMNRYHYRK